MIGEKRKRKGLGVKTDGVGQFLESGEKGDFSILKMVLRGQKVSEPHAEKRRNLFLKTSA